MEIAYFVTAFLLCAWTYRQTRRSARRIRTLRRDFENPLD